MPARDVAERLEALEIRAAYQEQAIEDLNQAVLAHWKEIEALKRQLGRLGERIEASEQRADLAGLPEPPPPHY